VSSSTTALAKIQVSLTKRSKDASEKSDEELSAMADIQLIEVYADGALYGVSGAGE